MIRAAFQGLVVFIFLLTGSSLCFAADKEPSIPSTLSGTYSGGNEGRAIDSGYDVFSQDPNPISGSVSKHGNDLVVKVFNNSEDKYRVTFKLIQYGDRGNKVKSDSFSYTLDGGESRERTYKRRSTTKHEELKVENWRKLGGSKPKDEAKEE